ncbi:MAG: hypothetical protein E7667_06815 [Ruminococcaceae bacterium]|nr:hypothetical protein [Oscillospiraceae bacterium]
MENNKKEFAFNTQWAVQVILAAVAIVLSAFLGIDGVIIAIIGGVYILCFVIFIPVGFAFDCESITRRFVFCKKTHDLRYVSEIEEGIAGFRLYPRGYYYNVKFSGDRAFSIKIPKTEKTSDMMKKYVNKKGK